MSTLVNLTPFAATCLPSMSREDEALTLVVVSGRFVLPPAGPTTPGRPTIAATQGDVPLADEYTAGPGSSLRREGQSAYTRPGTDIHLLGHAWAPGGRPVTRSDVGLHVGPCRRHAVILGDRTWTAGIGVAPGRPQPFTRIPLVYERCFGGDPERATGSVALAAEHNPVGRGLHASEREAIGQPLPNIEDPRDLLDSPARHPRPCGFGPVARHWRPRRGFAGTYDQAWLDARIPLWPSDVDERFFHAAPPELQASQHLVGGELVRIFGMHPDGPHTLRLPRYRLRARFERGRSTARKPLVLDAVEFDTDLGALTMTWRVALVANPLELGAVVVRALEDWEDD